MKTPLFQEVKLSVPQLEDDLAHAPWGEGPLFVSFPGNDDPDFHRMALSRLKNLLQQKKISPFFPYPIYVISKYLGSRMDFPVLEEEKQLPIFFKAKRRELTAKEIPFIKKIQLLANKVTNSNIEAKLNVIKKMAIENRKLFELTSETHFYQFIHKKIKEDEKSQR